MYYIKLSLRKIISHTAVYSSVLQQQAASQLSHIHCKDVPNITDYHSDLTGIMCLHSSESQLVSTYHRCCTADSYYQNNCLSVLLIPRAVQIQHTSVSWMNTGLRMDKVNIHSLTKYVNIIIIMPAFLSSTYQEIFASKKKKKIEVLQPSLSS